MVRLLCFVAGMFLASAAIAQTPEWRYEVRPGDSLWDIAPRHLRDLRDWQVLKNLNSVADPKRLTPGSSIRIPVGLMREVEVAGTVLAVTGEVLRKAQAARAATPMGPGQRFTERDVITAGIGGAATLLMPDGSKLRMAEGSELEVIRLRRFADTMLFDSRLRLQRGRVETEVRPVGIGGRFEILTPAAVTSVRGTDYRVKAAEALSTTEVLEGKVGFANGAGATEVPGGFGASVRAGEKPKPPTPLLPAPDLSGVPGAIGRVPASVAFPGVTGAAAYRVSIGGDAEFSRVMADQLVSVPEVAVPALPDGQYFLRVRAVDGQDIEGIDATRSLAIVAPPGAPTAMTPEDRFVVGDDPVRFEWQPGKGASRSRLEFAEDEAFQQVVGMQESTQSSLTVAPPFAERRRLFWRVGAIGASPEVIYSAVRKLRRPPAAAVLPDELSLDAGTTVGWTAIPRAAAYRVQVLPAAPPDAAPVVDRETTDTALSVANLIPGEYRLRVQGVDADGTPGKWGRTVKLTVRELPLPVPSLTAADGTEQVLRRRDGILLRWRADPLPPRGYRLQVARDSAFAGPLVVDRIVGSEHQFAVPPQWPAGRYHWRIASVGHTMQGAFSEAGTFEKVLPPPVLAPVEVHSGNGDIPIGWPPIAGAAGYRVEVSDATGSPAMPVISASGPQIALPGVQPGVYAVRAQALAEDGTPGDFGQPVRLVVMPPLLPPPDVVAPAGGSVLHDGEARLRWAPVDGATGYEVEIAGAPDAGWTSGLRRSTGSSLVVAPDRGRGTMSWRVRAVRGDEAGPFSEIRRVTLAPAAPRIVGVLAAPESLEVALGQSTGAVRTCVEMDRSESFVAPAATQCVEGGSVKLDPGQPGRWYLRARGVDADGVASLPGPVVEADVPARPEPPRYLWWPLVPLGLILLAL
jgi:hypothetical protein